MHAADYLKESCKMVRQWSEDENRKRIKKRKVAMIQKYRPEIGISDKLREILATRFQQMIGILRWSVELGRIDIITEVSILSSHNVSPRRGHLEAAYQIFEYLSTHERGGRVVFDHSIPDVDETKFDPDIRWGAIYGDLTEELPMNMPTARGNLIVITMFCDAAFAGDIVTRRSQTGILIFLNGAPITWYSKRQNTVEASTFGSEFVALRVGIEMNDALRYKLRMMGIYVKGPTNVYCDNKSVVCNATLAESTLKKKHLSVCYHKVRENYAKGAVRIAYEPTESNLADVCTKVLSQEEKKKKMKNILY